MLYLSIRYYYYAINNSANSDRDSVFKSYARVSVWTPQWWQVEKVNPIKLYEENKVIAGFSLLNLLFKQGRYGLVRTVVEKLMALYSQKKIKPLVDSLWALEEVGPMPELLLV